MKFPKISSYFFYFSFTFFAVNFVIYTLSWATCWAKVISWVQAEKNLDKDWSDTQLVSAQIFLNRKNGILFRKFQIHNQSEKWFPVVPAHRAEV